MHNYIFHTKFAMNLTFLAFHLDKNNFKYIFFKLTQKYQI